MSGKSNIRDNHERGSAGDFLRDNIEPNSKLSIVSAYFTIYAYKALEDKLSAIESLDFLFGEPTFIKAVDPGSKNYREYKIEDDQLIIPLENRLTQRAPARECANWIREKVNIKSMVKPNFLHGKMYHIQQQTGIQKALVGSSNFTVHGLGLSRNSNIELNVEMTDDRDRNDLKDWFYKVWNDDTGLVEDVKEEVLKYIEQLYAENGPEFVYFKTLYHLFESFLSEQEQSDLLNENTGFFETKIWNMLYSFQKDAVKGAINKIQKHNGCIIADSVGLGKTLEALAIIKYFELLNCNVLVLCPKKLIDNWTIYQGRNNSDLNPLRDDRLGYTVLSHTDLSRESGRTAGNIDLSTLSYGNFDLVVIDESHNFRNNTKGKRDAYGNLIRKSRYEKLMEDIIQEGINTKVLMLSATPVNNNLKDLRNQLSFISQGRDDAFQKNIGITSLAQTIKNAQTVFTNWADPSKNKKRNVKALLDNLDTSFFALLDALSIARSRKHIEIYYKDEIARIGAFPKRLPVQSKAPGIDLKDEFPSYDKINKEIMGYRLSLFNPAAYVRPEYAEYYAALFKSPIEAFTQARREHYLIGMMKVNFLKRLESSIKSFEISMSRTIEKINLLEKRINAYKEKKSNESELEAPELNDAEDEELSEANSVGKSLKYRFEHLDLDQWLRDLQSDKDALLTLKNLAASITPERDKKLFELKELIRKKAAKPLNKGNKKVLIFTAFSDTADYLYEQLRDFVAKELGLHIALVVGSGTNKATLGKSDFHHILTNFSPISKNREKLRNMPQDEEIDILIASDCISEGQNLQDCDYLINYDIHWNPVRIIQRFGRIDRLGSQNKKIQLVNFWPTDDLNQYIDLKDRVEARMALVDIAATGEDNLLDPNQLRDLIEEDLSFRDRQLKRLKEEVLDLEELDENLSLSEFSLDDFRNDLSGYLEKNRERLENSPLGLYAVVPSPTGKYADMLKSPTISDSAKAVIQPGVIYCLRQRQEGSASQAVNPLSPYYLVYMYDDQSIRFHFAHPKQILEIFRLLAAGKDAPYEELCEIFNQKTGDGADMDHYSGLLTAATDEIARVFQKRASTRLTNNRSAQLIPGLEAQAEEEPFELISWLIIL